MIFLHKLRHSLHDFVSRISGCTRKRAIVFSIGTIVLNPPLSSPHPTLPIIGYYKDSVSGEVSKWQFPKVQLFAVPTDISAPRWLVSKNWNFIETDCICYIYRENRRATNNSLIFECHIKSWTLLFHYNLYKFMSPVYHLTKLISAGSLYLNCFPTMFLISSFSLYCALRLDDFYSVASSRYHNKRIEIARHTIQV